MILSSHPYAEFKNEDSQLYHENILEGSQLHQENASENSLLYQENMPEDSYFYQKLMLEDGQPHTVMIADCHLHTEFSTDSTTKMEDQIQQAIRLGMKHMCITDHMDFDFPGGEFSFDTDAYVTQVLELREKYKNQIYVALGVELGLQYHLKERINTYLKKYPFDFAIGSMHLLHGEDPYHGAIFERMGDEEAYREYFRETHRVLKQCPNVDTFGHLDYVVRYGKTKAQNYSYKKFSDEIDAILKDLIAKGIALEVNTAGFKTLGVTNPHPDIVKRYRELGGEMITIGSDGHVPEYLGHRFETLKTLLNSCGFEYYTVFKQRKATFEKIL